MTLCSPSGRGSLLRAAFLMALINAAFSTTAHAQIVPNQGVRAVGPNTQPSPAANLGATLYPYGPAAGDTALPKSDDGYELRSLDPLDSNGLHYKIPFMGGRHPNYVVAINGVVSFGSGLASYSPESFPRALGTPPIVAPFWADVDTRPEQYGGNVYHRVITDYATRMEIGARMTNCYLDYVWGVEGSGRAYRRGPFKPTLAIVATWDRVGCYDRQTDRVNTFQAVIATDGLETHALFLYPNQAIWWDYGSASTGIHASGGGDAGDQANYYNIPGARTTQMRDLWFLSNTMPAQPGVQIHKLTVPYPNFRYDPLSPPASWTNVINYGIRDILLGDAPAGHVLKFDGGGFDSIYRVNPTNPVRLTHQGGSSTTYVNDTGALTGPGFDLEGGGSFVLCQPGAVHAPLILSGGVTLRLLAPEALSASADLVFRSPSSGSLPGGTLQVTENATIGSLASTGTLPGSVTGTARLVVTNDEDAVFNGKITGALSFVKRGPALQTLGGDNAYTGTTTLEDGTLGLASNTATGTGPLVIRGGVIRASGAERTLTKPLTVEGDFGLGRLTHFTGQTTLTKEVKITSTNPDQGAAENSFFSGGITGPGGLTFTEAENPVGKIRLGGLGRV